MSDEKSIEEQIPPVTQKERLCNALFHLSNYVRTVVLPNYPDPALENITALAEHVLAGMRMTAKRITFSTCNGCKEGWCFEKGDMCIPDNTMISKTDEEAFLCAFYADSNTQPEYYLLTQTEFDILNCNLPGNQRIERVEE